MNLLEVDRLSVEFRSSSQHTVVVREVSFSLASGQRLALVGESGSGKTVTALSMLRLNQDAHYGGAIRFDGRELLTMPERELRGVRGREIAMVFQEPMSALNPLFSIGEQICEVIELHEGVSRAQAVERALDMLERVRIGDTKRRFSCLPHQLSGGQRQRAMIAMALACKPRLLIADEPTTALDVTIQHQIVELLLELQAEFGMAVLLITHDLPLVSRFAEHVVVMRDGQVLEAAATRVLFNSPSHDYTRSLLASRSRRLVDDALPAGPTVLQADRLTCTYKRTRGWLRTESFQAVKDLSFSVGRGQTLGIVGESGSGKTTLGMSLLRLASATGTGGIEFDGRRIDGLSQNELRPLRRQFQVVFQDPFNSLSPRQTIRSIVEEGLALHEPDLDAQQRLQAVRAALAEVGLPADILHRYPHEFSGGQRQRIAIARVLIIKPALVLLDEPTSALDQSVQAQVLELLVRMQERLGLTYLLITHDLSVVRAMAHAVLVMKDGTVVEQGATATIFDHAEHAYTRDLVSAAQLRPDL